MNKTPTLASAASHVYQTPTQASEASHVHLAAKRPRIGAKRRNASITLVLIKSCYPNNKLQLLKRKRMN